MYSFLRIIFGLVLVLALIILVKKTQIKKVFVVLISVGILLTTIVLYFVPIENILVRFSTPQKAYNYYRFGRVCDVVEGEDSAYISALRGTGVKYDFVIFPKDEKGWKIGTHFDQCKVARYMDKDISITVYNIRKTEDYYVVVFYHSLNQDVPSLSDNFDSSFKRISSGEYVTCVTGLDSSYCVYYNDQTINVLNP